MPPRLSPIDAISPAFQRLADMLFRPFRVSRWVKIGFIGWLAGGGAGGSLNYNTSRPSFPAGMEKFDPFKDLPKAMAMVQAWLVGHLVLVVLVAALVVLLSLAFGYLSCRFRFIQLDAVLTRDPAIKRAWRQYGPQTNRFFGFWAIFMLASWLALFFIIVRPLWMALKSGGFSKDPLGALFGLLATLLLGLLIFGLVAGIITTLANDFVVPLLAIEDLSLGEAWSYLGTLVSAEPGAFAGYMGMKLVLYIVGGIASSVIFLICFLILLLPMLLLVFIGILAATALKTLGAAGAILGAVLAVVGALVGVALILLLTMLAIAPFAVFFTSYSVYFLGGRVPRLGAILWPAPPVPPAPLPAGMPPPSPGPWTS
ncbi:MAG: hypothetical protein LAO20_03410 [Acidobacteriia bacterium]|nr:hypothetical protein [Terriglobia bacterium]